ncbi:hypothetical protein CMK13_16370 [Candidatus Poribacteria bacterium]|nr:hypothetical protein [Candidatus Poribacteria bacterium]OUT56411.1 MAG: hypothetical protein CBB75_15735 [bacterium TMED15]
MPDYLLKWAYSSNNEQRKEILEDMRLSTQTNSLTTTDPDEVLRVDVAQHYVKSVTDVNTITIPPAVSQNGTSEIPSALDWLKSAEKPTRVPASYNGGGSEIERQLDPRSLLADDLESMLQNKERYTNCSECGNVISLANGGRYPRKFCSDNCRQRDYRKKKKQKEMN